MLLQETNQLWSDKVAEGSFMSGHLIRFFLKIKLVPDITFDIAAVNSLLLNKQLFKENVAIRVITMFLIQHFLTNQI